MNAYPNAAGFKDNDTSRMAAQKVNPKREARCKLLLDAFLAAGWDGLTAHEACTIAGLKVRSGAPRITELKAQNLLVKTTARRKNDEGSTLAVLRHRHAAPPKKTPIPPMKPLPPHLADNAEKHETGDLFAIGAVR